MKTTATAQMQRMNVRRNRAMALASAVIQKIEPFLRDRTHQEAYCALVELFDERGVEILTDDARAEYGFPPRGPDGWTVEEVAAMDRRTLEAMTKPLPVVMFAPKVTEGD